MLVEKVGQQNTYFRVGETVKIIHLNQTGTITGFKDGQWQVKLTEGNIIPCEAGCLERKEILMG